jgi:hypothetical protein
MGQLYRGVRLSQRSNMVDADLRADVVVIGIGRDSHRMKLLAAGVDVRGQCGLPRWRSRVAVPTRGHENFMTASGPFRERLWRDLRSADNRPRTNPQL